jgi:hypothetical protein
MFGIPPPMPLILKEGVLKEHANISFIPKLGSLDSDKIGISSERNSLIPNTRHGDREIC